MIAHSTWHIWDFHLHTPCSALNNQFGASVEERTWDEYITNVENKAKEKGIAAIAFTDYFTIDGYKRVLEYKRKGRLENILVIPNIEFRIDKIIYRNKDGSDAKRLNFHVIFSPDIDPRDIEEGFLHDLDFYYEGEPFDKNKTRKLKPYNLEDFGKKLKEQEPKFTGSNFEVGCKTVVVQSMGIKETLDARFRGQYLLALADENLSLVEWGNQDHPTRQQLIQMSHVVLSSNQGTREFCLGKRHPSTDDYLREFKSFKPCIWGCDSHSYSERFLEPDEKRYTWIKGEVTWEGLKSVIYEPIDRVRIQESNPEHPKSIFTLKEVEIADTQINPNLQIKSFSSELNSNLVTVIGGRGSGKTALLDLISSSFREGNKLSELENSFYYRLYRDEKSTTSPSVPIATNIKFLSGETFSKNIGQDEVLFDKSDILYLTQNHFDEYSSNPSKLNAYVIELVFERFPNEKRKYREMEDEISSLEREIQNINLEIEQLVDEIEGQAENENANLNIKKGEREDLEKRLNIYQEKQGAENEEILKLTNRQEALMAKKRAIESSLYQLALLLSAARDFDYDYRAKAKEINRTLNSILEIPNTQLLEELPDLQNVLSMTPSIETTLQTLLSTVDTSIAKAENEIGALEGLSKEIADLQTEINNVSLEVEDIEVRINLITSKEQRINQLAEERYSVYSSILQRTIELKIFLQETIAKFEVGKNELLDHLKFSALVDTNKSVEVMDSLLEKVDNRVSSSIQLNGDFRSIVKNTHELLNTAAGKVNFSQIIMALKEFASSLKTKKAISLSDLYNTILQRYFVIGLGIKFGGKDLSDLSMGERAVVLLKVLLALDDTPLLIDQPEEHLDNRYIYDELVPAFRKAKTKRQIIIATHNANLVVNTDAEQIIVANYSNGILSYTGGTLENLKIREQIKTILEGGDEAFKKREEKYGYIF